MSDWESDTEIYKPIETVHCKVESLAKGDFKVTIYITDSPRALAAIIPEVTEAFEQAHKAIGEYMKSTTTE